MKVQNAVRIVWRVYQLECVMQRKMAAATCGRSETKLTII